MKRRSVNNLLGGFSDGVPSLCLLMVFLFGAAIAADAQIRIGTIRGSVTDANNDLIQNAELSLRNDFSGFRAAATTDDNGEFAFNNVPFAHYDLIVSANGFASSSSRVVVASNIPVRQDLRLSIVATRFEVDVDDRSEAQLDPQQTSTETQLSEERLQRIPNVVRNHALQRFISTIPGVTTQNNGLLHVRGVEDGILYVSGGVPTTDRLDAVSASSFDIGTVRSVQVITGNFPAEFGGRSGAIAIVQPKSGVDESLRGDLTASSGNFRTADAAGSIAYGWRKRIGIFAAAAGSRSDRFLDPVDERNFNNRGSRRNLNMRLDWQPSERDYLVLDLGVNGADLRVPNDLEQEMAGQRQRQQLRDNDQSISWQRAWNNSTATNLIWFRRSYASDLFPSEFDIPLSASQDRHQSRAGLIASVSHLVGGHSLKAGFEATRINVREFFSFAITDAELAEDREISDAAQAFTPANPFVFSDARRGSYSAAYIQDAFSPFRNLTVSAGLRYERTSLPVTESQVSPRLGVAYFVPRTNTVFRASINRLFQPPQLENLLLSDSPQARALSPFLDETEGGERVRPERVWAYEIGAAQRLWNLGRLDAAFWWRNFENHGDPNTFFNTTIVFQNSVRKGFSRGLDLRLDIAERRGFSGYLSYTNSRILQTGPINGGLFLTDEFIEIGPGTRFIPDHDQRNVGSFAITYNQNRHGWFATFGGRHESGVPLEVEDERMEELMSAPGSELVDFGRERVRPWTVFDLQAGFNLLRGERRSLRLEVNVRNIFNRRFAYNFGSPFEGTHFGHPRLLSGRVSIGFR
jgi:hypothetical protein